MGHQHGQHGAALVGAKAPSRALPYRLWVTSCRRCGEWRDTRVGPSLGKARVAPPEPQGNNPLPRLQLGRQPLGLCHLIARFGCGTRQRRFFGWRSCWTVGDRGPTTAALLPHQVLTRLLCQLLTDRPHHGGGPYNSMSTRHQGLWKSEDHR